MDVNELRKHFPILSSSVYGKKLVYFDNAATSQRPREVIDLFGRLSLEKNANIHRAVHYLSSEATAVFEQTRQYVASFIGASDPKEIVFTSGATAAINLLSFSFGEAFVHEGDEIIVTEAEHHSNIVPWQMLCQRKGAKLKVLPVDEDGQLRTDILQTLLSPRTKLLAITHISNVLGLVNPLETVISMAHAAGACVVVDGSQGIVHQDVDVQKLNCDFYVFSGHKVYAVPGTGVLYGRKKLLEAMPPYMGGGEMIRSVSFAQTTYADVPHKFEAGTQNISGIPTLRPALEMAMKMRALSVYGAKTSAWLNDALMHFPGLRMFGVPHGTTEKGPLFSFTVEGVHHEDLALILDKMGIAVRSGQMCAEPLMDRYGVSGMLRVSLAPYNTREEAETFMEALERAVKMLK